ncbi:MAG: pyrroline-5-carboxylate reductase [Ferruginibacter sp.]
MKFKSISIIGGGNLGIAIATGLINRNFCPASAITITRRNTAPLFGLQANGVHITNDNKEAVNNSEIIILAVKPFQIKDILVEICPELTASHILVSAVTGVSTGEIEEVIKARCSIFRAMPNTAIAIGESMTCLSSPKGSEADRVYVSALFSALGKTTFIEEQLMNAATVLGACGTAFAMRYIRASIQGGIEIGFDASTASLIAAQTVKGAAELLLTTHTHPEHEIDKVTTPKGCTIAGLNEMEHKGFSSSLIKGIVASYNKIG